MATRRPRSTKATKATKATKDTKDTAIGFDRDPTTGELVCDGVPLSEVAEALGTPLYVYSAGLLRRTYRAIDQAFAPHPHALHYALKANSTLAILRLLRELGSRADANSGGEIEVALRAGFAPDDIVFTGVGKTADELRRAVALGVKTINAESAGELERIDAVARAQGMRARVALRVNPDIDAQSHPHISTGLKTNKFGVPIEQARAICREATARPGLALVGLHVHVGSQITTLAPLARAAAAVVSLARELCDDGLRIDHVDLGGGLGISYDGEAVPGVEEYAAALLPVVAGTGLEIVLEPGRAIAGPSGVLLGRVVDIKEHPAQSGRAGSRRFVVLDTGMTELLRPALYDAFHRIQPVTPRPGAESPSDIVGPICESSDVFGKDRPLPPLAVGDLLAVLDAGAYGSVMASNYNRRLLPVEALVDGGAWRVIRRRQTIDDLLALES